MSRYVTDNGGGVLWEASLPDEPDPCETRLQSALLRIELLEAMIADTWTFLPLYDMDTVKQVAL